MAMPVRAGVTAGRDTITLEGGEKPMIIGRLAHRSDLLQSLNKFAAAHDIKAGIIQVMGSLIRARLSFYDQEVHAYSELDFDGAHEVVSGTGNISLREGVPATHLHIAVADREGKVVGGHCLRGCTVFAVEFVIWPFKGTAPQRIPDRKTGLLLWEQSSYQGSDTAGTE